MIEQALRPDVLAAIANLVQTLGWLTVTGMAVRIAVWWGGTEAKVRAWAQALTGNHLAHIQAGVEQTADAMTELATEMKLHSERDALQHEQTQRALEAVRK